MICLEGGIDLDKLDFEIIKKRMDGKNEGR